MQDFCGLECLLTFVNHHHHPIMHGIMHHSVIAHGDDHVVWRVTEFVILNMETVPHVFKAEN